MNVKKLLLLLLIFLGFPFVSFSLPIEDGNGHDEIEKGEHLSKKLTTGLLRGVVRKTKQVTENGLAPAIGKAYSDAKTALETFANEHFPPVDEHHQGSILHDRGSQSLRLSSPSLMAATHDSTHQFNSARFSTVQKSQAFSEKNKDPKVEELEQMEFLSALEHHHKTQESAPRLAHMKRIQLSEVCKGCAPMCAATAAQHRQIHQQDHHKEAEKGVQKQKTELPMFSTLVLLLVFPPAIREFFAAAYATQFTIDIDEDPHLRVSLTGKELGQNGGMVGIMLYSQCPNFSVKSLLDGSAQKIDVNVEMDQVGPIFEVRNFHYTQYTYNENTHELVFTFNMSSEIHGRR